MRDPEFITNEQFVMLPLELKKRWWAETDHGHKAPSDELKQAMRDAVEPRDPEPEAA